MKKASIIAGEITVPTVPATDIQGTVIPSAVNTPDTP